MQLLPNLVWHVVGALNVWSAFKVLKPASRARKGVPARGVRERRREVELQVGLYVVWTAFQQVEAITDRTAYFLIPLYDEIKLGILLWMLASRTGGSDFVYRHLLRPLLATYDRPLELVFSLVFVIFEAVVSITLRPASDLVAAAAHKARSRWSGPPPKPRSTAALLEVSKEAVRSEESRAREVVKQARGIYEEIQRLQREPRPLVRSGSNDGQPQRHAELRPNAVAGPSSTSLASKPAKRPEVTAAAAAAPVRRAASAQPATASKRPSKPSAGSLLRPLAPGEARSPSAEPARLPRPGTAAAISGRIGVPAPGPLARKASSKRPAAIVSRPPPQRPLSPPPSKISADDFLLPLDPSLPSPVDLVFFGQSSTPDEPTLSRRQLFRPPAGVVEQQSTESIYPSLSVSPTTGAPTFAKGASDPTPAATSPSPLSVALEPPLQQTDARPLHQLAETQPIIGVSPSRLAFESRRLPRASFPATPAPPGSFLQSIRSGPTTAELDGGESLDTSTLTSLRSTSSSEEAAPKAKPTPRSARQPSSTRATRATPARRAKQKQQQQAQLPPPSPSVSPVRPPSSAGEGSAKRRKVSDRWEYVPVVENDELDALDLAEGKRRIQSRTVVVELEEAELAAAAVDVVKAESAGSEDSEDLPRLRTTTPDLPPAPAPSPGRSRRGRPVRRSRTGDSATAVAVAAPLRRRQAAAAPGTTADEGASSGLKAPAKTRTAAAAAAAAARPTTTTSGTSKASVSTARPTRAAAAAAAAVAGRSKAPPTAARTSALAGGPVRVRKAPAGSENGSKR